MCVQVRKIEVDVNTSDTTESPAHGQTLPYLENQRLIHEVFSPAESQGTVVATVVDHQNDVSGAIKWRVNRFSDEVASSSA